VEALNSDDERVENYDHTKGYALTADFSLFEDNAANASRLNVPTFSAAWVDGVGTFSWNNANGNTQCSSAFCWQKASTTVGYEDGPFTAGNSTNISISDDGIANPDPVVINQSQRELDPQPEIRFGRVSLDSAGGQTLSDISIPLQIEFWNGSRFEVDTADSTTNISGIESESDINIWTEEGMTAANVSLSGGGVVSSGTSRSINAAQSAAVRQQTQVWLDISALPWLRYNWDDDNATDDANGEQDPSTVVTFGIYRGNDRVIFRGEPGLTGQ
jgi:MSHA biogenesis protein MshQ